MTVIDRRKRHEGVAHALYTELRKHPGLLMYASDLARDLDLNRTSVDSALARMVSRKSYHVRRVSAGAYVFDPSVKADEPIFAANDMPVIRSSSTEPVEAEPEPEPEPNDQWWRATYSFVGTTGGLTIARDTEDNLYAVIPLAEYLVNRH